MLCKNNECNGNISHCNGCNIAPRELLSTLDSGKEGELGNCEEGLKTNAALSKSQERSKVDNDKVCIACYCADNGEDKSNCIAC